MSYGQEQRFLRLFLAAMGVLLLLFVAPSACSQFLTSLEKVRWLEVYEPLATQGKILEVEQSRYKSDGNHLMHIKYQFTAAQTVFEGGASVYLEQVPRGETLGVKYAKNNPAINAFVGESQWEGLAVVMVVLAFLFGVAYGVVSKLLELRKHRNDLDALPQLFRRARG